MIIFAHPLWPKRGAGFGVSGNEGGSCDVGVSVVKFFWDGDAGGAEGAFFVDMLRENGKWAVEAFSSSNAQVKGRQAVVLRPDAISLLPHVSC